jgi:hypothetical protein
MVREPTIIFNHFNVQAGIAVAFYKLPDLASPPMPPVLSGVGEAKEMLDTVLIEMQHLCSPYRECHKVLPYTPLIPGAHAAYSIFSALLQQWLDRLKPISTCREEKRSRCRIYSVL